MEFPIVNQLNLSYRLQLYNGGISYGTHKIEKHMKTNTETTRLKCLFHQTLRKILYLYQRMIALYLPYIPMQLSLVIS